MADDSTSYAVAQDGCEKHPPLGIYAKSSSPPLKIDQGEIIRNLRAERYQIQFFARHLLASRGNEQVKAGVLNHPLNIHRTAKCMHVRHSPDVDVYRSKEHQKAFLGGLVICGNVWACPVCAAKVQERRRAEIAQLFDSVYSGQLGSNKKMIMVTFTLSHSISDKLRDLLYAQAEAFRRLRAGKVWTKRKNRVGYEGLVRSLEVTYGANGWHPHTHEGWVVDADVDVDEFRDWLANRWFNICLKLGLATEAKKEHFLKHSVDIKDNCRASDYLAKQDDSRNWGVDRELAKASTKHGKKSGKHPFELLKDFENGDGKAGKTFLEYVFSMKGKAQLFWSRGLKDRVLIEDKTDEELANEKTDDADLLGRLNSDQWSVIIKHKFVSKVLDVAETQGWKGIISMLEKLKLSDPESPFSDVSEGDSVAPESFYRKHSVFRSRSLNRLEVSQSSDAILPVTQDDFVKSGLRTQAEEVAPDQQVVSTSQPPPSP